MTDQSKKTTDDQPEAEDGVTRRGFVKTGAAGVAAVAAVNTSLISRMAYAQEGGTTLGLGIVGCGGRGTGAIHNHLTAARDLDINVQLVAMGDLVQGRLDGSAQNVANSWADNYSVEANSKFVGVDAHEDVCAHEDVDIVIQTTPPGLRYVTLAEAVKNGKHSFVEKPVCVDAHSYRSVLASGGIADNKSVSIVTGTQYRRENSLIDCMEQMGNGLIGDITGAFSWYCAGTLWHNGDERESEGKGNWTQREYEMRNWLYFNWLSGDHIAEQSVHNVDLINWGFGGPPTKCRISSGGRIARTQPQYGNIYDHFSVDYEFDNGVLWSHKCRQYPGSLNHVSNRFVGTMGTIDIQPNPGASRWIAKSHDGERLASNSGRDGNNQPYVEEHKALLAGIVDGNPVQEIQECADSSLTAVMGRECAFAGSKTTKEGDNGQMLTFDFLAKESQLKLSPANPTVLDNAPLPYPDVRIPGTYRCP